MARRWLGASGVAILVASSSVECYSSHLSRRRSRYQTSLFDATASDTPLPDKPKNDVWVPAKKKETTIDVDGVIEQPLAKPPAKKKKKKKMELMWCNSDSCKDVVRERVIGEHNQIILNGPATGQVAYSWDDEPNMVNGKKAPTDQAHVLLLIKSGDEELLRIAADAVRQWTTVDRIHVLLVPGVAAKLKHYYGVDDDLIELFEIPDDPNDRNKPGKGNDWFDENISYDTDVIPDLVITLGGDGLLMYASSIFHGAVPPIISIAGGSLGFLTPFSRHEMVEAVRIALGTVKNDGLNGSGGLIDSSQQPEVFPPNMSSYPYEPIIKAPHVPGDVPKMSFGLGERICLSIRMRLDCRIVNREGVVKARYNVLNEVVVDRGSSSYLAALECFCDDVHLTTVQADGIIFATPTGSTAYSMAAGGSVVHPAVPCILVTPICPHVLSFRSMVFPDHVVLRCYVPEDARTHASVAFDGKHRRELPRGYSVWIKMSPYPVPTLNRGDHSSDWLESLKRSFNFNTRPRQRPM